MKKKRKSPSGPTQPARPSSPSPFLGLPCLAWPTRRLPCADVLAHTPRGPACHPRARTNSAAQLLLCCGPLCATARCCSLLGLCRTRHSLAVHLDPLVSAAFVVHLPSPTLPFLSLPVNGVAPMEGHRRPYGRRRNCPAPLPCTPQPPTYKGRASPLPFSIPCSLP